MRNFSEKELTVIHSYLLKLLKEFKRICDAENIWYTLAYGSVLGAVRHKGFIPWDTDADVCIKLSDVELFREAFYKHHSKEFKLIDRSTDPKALESHDTLLFSFDTGYPFIHLDIYPLVGAPNTVEDQNKVWKRNFYLDRIFRSKYVSLSDCLKKNRVKVFIVKCLDFFIPNSFIKANIKKRELEFEVSTSEYLTALAAPYKPVPKRVWDQIVMMQFEDTEFYVPGDWDDYLKFLYGDYMTPKKY